MTTPNSSRFEVDAKKTLKRWQAARRRKKLDPGQGARDKAWRKRMKQIEAAEPRLEEAGFNLAAHYWPGGMPSYCMCGDVGDHNARFDKILDGA